jgi:hypothetical protein
VSAAENDPVLVQNYLTGRLSDSDRRAFEEQLLKDAGLVRQLEESLRLREGFEVLREQKFLGEPVHLRRRAPLLRFALASAAAMAIIAVYLGVQSVNRSPPLVASSVAALHARSSNALMVVEHYSFVALRAADTTPDLPLPATGALELRTLAPVAYAGRKFRVTLEEIRNQKTSRIGFAEHLVPDADGFVVIYADASLLQPGDFELSVAADGEAGKPAERFAFKLKRASDAATLERLP